MSELILESPSVRERIAQPRIPLSNGRPDNFQTPAIALQPLMPYLKRIGAQTIWEPACGNGNLVAEFRRRGISCLSSDILTHLDFLTMTTGEHFDAIVTNPPFSLKDEFVARCYQLGKPFALLMPLTALEGIKRQNLYRRHGLELILMDKRINFETPSGKQGGSWFATAWFTYRLNIGQGLTFARFNEASDCLEMKE